MKQFLFSMMLLSATSLSCHAQAKQFEYDNAGNLIKVSQVLLSDEYSLGSGYIIKLSFPSSGKMNVKLCDEQSKSIVDCHIEVSIHHLSSVSFPAIKATSDKGDFDVDISALNNTKLTYGLDVNAVPNKSKDPIQQSIKFQVK